MIKNTLTLLLVLFSFKTFAADYQVEFIPANNSVGAAQVSSIPSSKISDFSQAVNNELPAGMIMPYAGATCPVGWIEGDGAEVSRTGKARLFTALGVSHGSGNGSTTFNLPDYRGRFLRGLDRNANRDEDKASRVASNPGGNTGNMVGSVQSDQFKSHSHNYTSQDISATASASSGIGALTRGDAVPNNVNVIGNRSVKSDNLGAIWPSGGSETRPENVTVIYCVKE